MKKLITLVLTAYLCLSNLNAQTNLITNPGFETDPATVTGTDNTNVNQLRRISSTTATYTSSTYPAPASPASPGVSVVDGLWLKKTSVLSSVFCQRLTTPVNSGTYSVLMRVVSTSSSVIDWTNFATQQRLSLDNTKKYTLTFYASISGSTATPTFAAFIADKNGVVVANVTSQVFTPSIRTFTKYTATFNLASAIAGNAALDFSTAYVGVGFNPTYTGTPSKTESSYLYLDDFSLIESSTTPVISSTTSTTTNQNPIPISITFNYPVTGFTSSDLVVSNGNVSNFAGSGASYTADITPTSPGAVTVNIAAGAAADALSNATLAATQFTRTYDNVAPTVTITSTTGTTTAANPIPVTITFSKQVTGFDVTDLVIGNGTAGNFVAASTTVFTADITPTSLGQVTVDIAANAAQDAATNGSIAATQFARTYTDQTTSVTNISSDSKVYSVNNEIVIEGCSSQNLSIYSGLGQLIKSIQLNSDRVSVPVKNGLYLVNIGDKNHKLLVK